MHQGIGLKRLALYAMLSTAVIGCTRNERFANRGPAGQPPNDVEQWIVTWLRQAPAMSEWVTLSRIDHRLCMAARR